MWRWIKLKVWWQIFETRSSAWFRNCFLSCKISLKIRVELYGQFRSLELYPRSVPFKGFRSLLKSQIVRHQWALSPELGKSLTFSPDFQDNGWWFFTIYLHQPSVIFALKEIYKKLYFIIKKMPKLFIWALNCIFN